MPTIDELERAVVSADDDSFPVSQNGIARRVTRSQLLSGTQQAITMTPGLLGRTSTGIGNPEQIQIGGGLRLANGLLSGPAQFAVAALPATGTAAASDILPISQGGMDHAISVAALLSSPGVNVSTHVAQASVGITRHISEWLGDALAVEAFGAVGDGATDDTAALTRAVASGRPLLLGPKTYRVDGQWTISVPPVLLGIAGLTTLRRGAQKGGAWINVNATSMVAVGVTFDAGSLNGDSWGVLVGSSCKETLIENCRFLNATGPTLGSGLVIQARDGRSGGLSSHKLRGCVFANNGCHGLWIQAAAGAQVEGCLAFENGGYGICLDFNDPQFQQVVRECVVSGCRCWGNVRGISVGNFNATNTEPPTWGLSNPDAIDILLVGNVCTENSAYGIAASGERISVAHNQISTGAATGASGVLLNAFRSKLSTNIIAGAGQFGIDAGGSVQCEIECNSVSDFSVGINAGGSEAMRVLANSLRGNERAVTVFQVETDGLGRNFGVACTDVRIEGNSIDLQSGSSGIVLLDGPQQVVVVNNSFVSADDSVAGTMFWAHTDSVSAHGNSWNGVLDSPGIVVERSGVNELQYPDLLDAAVIPVSSGPISSIVGQHQSLVRGQVTFVKVVNQGTGYTQAAITLSGSGTGATATVYLRDGRVIGIAVLSGGSGYDTATTIVTITGDGQGASAEAFVGIPIPNSRRLRLRCDGPTVFRSGGTPALSLWTGSLMTVPQGGEIAWIGVGGQWQAASFSNTDWLQNVGDGSLILQSAGGDIRLRPGTTGHVRVVSDTEMSGYLSCLGRGSPNGVVSAPPGSDYRNLDGGIGATLWLKQTGTGAAGWVAIA